MKIEIYIIILIALYCNVPMCADTVTAVHFIFLHLELIHSSHLPMMFQQLQRYKRKKSDHKFYSKRTLYFINTESYNSYQSPFDLFTIIRHRSICLIFVVTIRSCSLCFEQIIFICTHQLDHPTTRSNFEFSLIDIFSSKTSQNDRQKQQHTYKIFYLM